MEQPDGAWWRRSTVYQIYPKSFMDSDGDGVGDLRGITSKLDYLHALGVDVVWLCPVYPHGGVDGGYDITDYRAIAPEFGTLADWQELLAGLHARGMRLVMDLVVNHTSDRHPWFLEARSSTDSPYRDYYLWQPGRDSGPPSNWGSHFGGSAWQLDPATGESYLHLFAPEQPDLNWENPRVRREVYDLMTFWLELGIDGFRMDTINMLSKVPGYPDTAPGADYAYPLAEEHFLNGPRLLDYLREMRAEVLSRYDVMTVGETPGTTPEQAAVLTDPQTGPLDMVFQFDHMAVDKDTTSARPRWTTVPYAVPELKRVLGRWQTGLHGRGWNSLYLGNHDVPRMVSRFGDDGEHRAASAKMLATLLFTLQGTPYVYQGDELGMPNARFTSIDDYRDVDTLNLYREDVTQGGRDPAEVLAMIHAKGRDNARTPMPWTAGEHAGFTTGTPWIPLNPTYPDINAEAAVADPDSVYWYYRDLIRLRREHPAIVDGRYDDLRPTHDTLYAYLRTHAQEQLLVLLNFGGAVLDLDGVLELPANAELLIGNYTAPGEVPPGVLQPWEARVYVTRTVEETGTPG